MRKFDVKEVGEEFDGYIGFEPLFFEEKLEHGETIASFADENPQNNPDWANKSDEEKSRILQSTMISMMKKLFPIVKQKIVKVEVSRGEKKYTCLDHLSMDPATHPILSKFITYYAQNMSLGNE